jgi:hypothetical protein
MQVPGDKSPENQNRSFFQLALLCVASGTSRYRPITTIDASPVSAACIPSTLTPLSGFQTPHPVQKPRSRIPPWRRTIMTLHAARGRFSRMNRHGSPAAVDFAFLLRVIGNGVKFSREKDRSAPRCQCASASPYNENSRSTRERSAGCPVDNSALTCPGKQCKAQLEDHAKVAPDRELRAGHDTCYTGNHRSTHIPSLMMMGP